MSSFNRFERFLATGLRRFPGVKKSIKRIYQKGCYLYYKRPYQFKLYEPVAIQKIGFEDEESFFGYYDKSPMNLDGRWILFHSVPKTFSTEWLPDPDSPISIAVYDTKTQSSRLLLQSYAYNWQQGSKAHWVTPTQFISNAYCEDTHTYYSRRYDMLTDQVIDRYPISIYDSTDNYGLGLSFERLQLLRPDYGYRCHSHLIDLDDLDKDGIFYLDFETRISKLLISLKQISEFHNEKIPKKGVLHKVNHIMISPDQRHFVCLHRYYVNQVKYDRLLLANCYGDLLAVLADHHMVSHYTWQDKDTIIGFLRQFETGDQYFQIDIPTRSIQSLDPSIQGDGDGHPSCFQNWILTDTYPNKARMKQLFLYQNHSQELRLILEAYESFKFQGETRCDLHPRWSMDGNYIFFDSVHDGKRQLYQIKTPDIDFMVSGF